MVNAIAHRDYSEEGRGIEIYVYDDRMEIRNPGELLSSISVDDLRSMKGNHESRNSYMARTLREIGYMRELGEGMRRIFELMKTSELAPPEIISTGDAFSLQLHHKPMYSHDEVLWLEQYDIFNLSAEQKAIVLLGRNGRLIAPQDIWDRLGIVDTEHYRQVLASLQKLGILESTITKGKSQSLAKQRKVSRRDIPRFKILLAKDVGKQERKSRIENTKTTDLELEDGSVEDRTVFVANLPPSVNERDMYSAFEEFGDIERITLPRTGKLTRGFGFVVFEEASVVTKLLTNHLPVRMGPFLLVIRRAHAQLRKASP